MSRSRSFAALISAAMLTVAIPVRAYDAKQKETLWSVGEDKDGCFAATDDAGMGITYSASDRFRVFFAGGSGNATSPSPSVEISIGQLMQRLPLKAIGDDGWLLDDEADVESIKAFIAEMLKGTSGPITIKSSDAGIDMSFETASLQSRGTSFWQCVKRQTPGG